jgi:hypothetical protein
VDSNPSQTTYPLSRPPDIPIQQLRRDSEIEYPRPPNTPGAVLERADQPKDIEGYSPVRVP